MRSLLYPVLLVGVVLAGCVSETSVVTPSSRIVYVEEEYDLARLKTEAANALGPQAAPFVERMAKVEPGWTRNEVLLQAGEPVRRMAAPVMWQYEFRKAGGGVSCFFRFAFDGDKVSRITRGLMYGEKRPLPPGS